MAEAASNSGLLPEGLRDALFPEARHADLIRRQLLDKFASYGYEQVMPPLIEFESGLAGRLEAEKIRDMFRLLDSESQQMMVLRSDITGQVARIAATRLGHLPRPLRLSYAGAALRVKGSQLRPERQFGQAGVELIGPHNLQAALEVISLAHETVLGLGLENTSIDLVFPSFVPKLVKELGLDEQCGEHLLAALEVKDIAALAQLDDDQLTFKSLLLSAGPAKDAIRALDAIKLPPKAAQDVQDIKAFVAAILEMEPQLELTLDPVERRGFSYQGDFGFAIYCSDVKAELGRGGRYGIRTIGTEVEPATGFSFYLDSLSKVVAPLEVRKKVYVPQEVSRVQVQALQNDGWITVQGLVPEGDLRDEAQRLRCTHLLLDGSVRALTE